VTPQTLPLLFRLLSDIALPIRLATSQALLKILQKGLKEPFDKLQLIRVLSIGDVLVVLEERTRIPLGDSRSEDETDKDVQYRESLGKLGGGLGLELIKLLDEVTIHHIPLTL
jgi:exportin-T